MKQEQGLVFRDNYKDVVKAWQQRSLTWDWQKKFASLGLPAYQGDVPGLTYYGVYYQWDPADGHLYEAGQPQRELDFATLMNIYQIIFHENNQPRLAGEWIPLHQVKRTNVFTSAFRKSTLEPFAAFFSGRPELLIRAGEKLGFERIKYSDAGFEAKVFECLPIRFLFWDGDEEFPAQANILFDANITDFVHEESVVMIGSDGAERLIETAQKI